MNQFRQQILERSQALGSRVCVGLDPVLEDLPEQFRNAYEPEAGIVAFLKAIVDATSDVAVVYKPNRAFFARYDAAGERALERVIDHIHTFTPGTPVILDAKEGDIGKTNRGYAEEAFGRYQADALTLNPYLGMKANEPFLKYEDKGLIFLCRTSNEGSDEFQCLMVDTPQGHMRMFEYMALRVSEHWNTAGNCGLVAGATFAEDVGAVRARAPDMLLLLPGFGSQGAKAHEVIPRVKSGSYVGNSSSAILNAHLKHPDLDFADAARDEALRFRDELREASLLSAPSESDDQEDSA
jgi:orotidine-5'-phosphate decarboxylase